MLILQMMPLQLWERKATYCLELGLYSTVMSMVQPPPSPKQLVNGADYYILTHTFCCTRTYAPYLFLLPLDEMTERPIPFEFWALTPPPPNAHARTCAQDVA
jgi:hypothetical protein